MEEAGYYNYAVDGIRSREFPSLKGVTYVDHAGATLYSGGQLAALTADLRDNLYGNPHSASAASKLTADTVDHVRYRVLKLFNTTPDDYSVIFTSGCTGALKLLAESFSFAKQPPELHQPGNQQHHPSLLLGEATRHGGLQSSRDSAQNTGRKAERREEDRDTKTATTQGDDDTAQGDDDTAQGDDDTAQGDDDTTQNDDDTATQTPSSEPKAKGKGPAYVPLASGTKSAGERRRGCFCYLQDNHTSVQGMRELAAERCRAVLCVTEEELLQGITGDSVVCGDLDEALRDADCNCLLAFPGQSNFSGRKYPLGWVAEARAGRLGFQSGVPGRWFVLLDAASLVSTSPLDLSAVCPDFVTISFYKIFGFPTGLGALLVRTRAGWTLDRRYYGGGTVAASTARQRFCALKPNLSDRFEDGTLPYLDIVALRHGFNALETLGGGMERISSHTFLIAQYFAHHLASLRHSNGNVLAHIHTSGSFNDRATQGAIVNFSLKRANGDYIGFAEVDKLAQLHDIHLRTGCFCNIGACQLFLNIASSTIRDNLNAGHVCGDDKDLIDGRPTGSVRISFGYMSSLHDAQRCLHFIAQCFLDTPSSHKPAFTAPHWFNPPVESAASQTAGSGLEKEIHGPPKGERESLGNGEAESSVGSKDTVSLKNQLAGGKGDNQRASREDVEDNKGDNGERRGEEGETERGKGGNYRLECSEKRRKLTDIFLYPIKSCGAFRVWEWEVGERGLLYDRTWMVVSESGVALGQKREPRLCLLKPLIHLHTATMELTFPGVTSYTIPLDPDDASSVDDVSVCTNKVCSDRVDTVDCGDGVAGWLCECLQRPGLRLYRQRQQDRRHSKRRDLTASGHRHSGEQAQQSQLSLANESQLLVVCRESVRSLQKKLAEAMEDGQTDSKQDIANTVLREEDSLVARFRANLVIDGGLPFDEDTWTSITCGHLSFVGQGQCSRCGMICLNQDTGDKSREPLRTLAAWRGGKVYFGVYMRSVSQLSRPVLKVGSEVNVL